MLSEPETETFSAPIGKIVLRHSIHSELGTLAESFRKKGVREVFFKINYDPKLVGLVRSLVDAGFTEREPHRCERHAGGAARGAAGIAAEKSSGEDAARCRSVARSRHRTQPEKSAWLRPWKCLPITPRGRNFRPWRATLVFPPPSPR